MLAARARPDPQHRAGARDFGGALIYRLLRDVADGFWNGVDYLWFCRWMP
jgi:hypothetical protein